MLKKFLLNILTLAVLIGQLAIFAHNFEFDSDFHDHKSKLVQDCEVCLYSAKLNHDGDFNYELIFKSFKSFENTNQPIVFYSSNKFNAFSVRAPPVFC
jgi:hypothetical protein